jgi:hypothetical protein
VTITKLRKLCERLEREGHGEKVPTFEVEFEGLFGHISDKEPEIDLKYDEVDFVLIRRIV